MHTVTSRHVSADEVAVEGTRLSASESLPNIASAARLSPAPSAMSMSASMSRHASRTWNLPVASSISHSHSSSVLPRPGSLSQSMAPSNTLHPQSQPPAGVCSSGSATDMTAAVDIPNAVMLLADTKEHPLSRYRACDLDEDEQANENNNAASSPKNRADIEFNSFAGMDSSIILNSSIAGGGGDFSSLLRAAFHIFKGNVGAGVFLLPTFYQDTGYLVGVVCVVLLGSIMLDCVLQLLRAKHAIDRSDVKTYPAVVDFVLGSWFKYFTDFALIFTQFGFCIMYIQYIASIFSSLVDLPYMYEVSTVLTVLIVTPMTFMTNRMHLLAYASLVAALFVVIVIVGTTIVDVQFLSSAGLGAGVVAFVPSARILVFLSGHMFALEGIGVVLPVENSLPPEKRPHFAKVVRYTLVSIITLYVVFGVLGYLAYGSSLRTSVVFALPPGWPKALMEVLLALSLLWSYPIQYVPAIQLVDSALHMDLHRDRWRPYTVRTALNAVFGIFALFIGADTINVFASFLGAFAGVHLMITIPTMLSLQLEFALDPHRNELSYKTYILQVFRRPMSAERAKYIAYLVLAFVVWIGGLYYTIDSVMSGPSPTTTTTTTTTPIAE